jgi:hypothetical protein
MLLSEYDVRGDRTQLRYVRRLLQLFVVMGPRTRRSCVGDLTW